MSTTRQTRASSGTTGVILCTQQGAEVLYSQDPNLSRRNQGPQIFPGGEANGAIVAMLGIDGIMGTQEIRVESPRGQSDLETIERTIGLLTQIRDVLATTAAAAA